MDDLDGVPSSPIREASIKPLGCPGDSLASFRHRGRWGSEDGFSTTSRPAASTSRAGGYPVFGGQAAVAAMAAAGSSSKEGPV